MSSLDEYRSVDARFMSAVLLAISKRFGKAPLTVEQFERIRQCAAEIERIVKEVPSE